MPASCSFIVASIISNVFSSESSMPVSLEAASKACFTASSAAACCISSVASGFTWSNAAIVPWRRSCSFAFNSVNPSIPDWSFSAPSYAFCIMSVESSNCFLVSCNWLNWLANSSSFFDNSIFWLMISLVAELTWVVSCSFPSVNADWPSLISFSDFASSVSASLNCSLIFSWIFLFNASIFSWFIVTWMFCSSKPMAETLAAPSTLSIAGFNSFST